jgi:hypothetical protein
MASCHRCGGYRCRGARGRRDHCAPRRVIGAARGVRVICRLAGASDAPANQCSGPVRCTGATNDPDPHTWWWWLGQVPSNEGKKRHRRRQEATP